MTKKFGEKQEKFAFRKLSVGLVSVTVASLFLGFAIASAPQAKAQTIQYKYVTEQELTDAEKEQVIHELPNLAEATDANYYLVYKPVDTAQPALPKTGYLENSFLALAGLGLLVLAVKVGKKGKKELAGVFILTATGATLFAPNASALTSHILAQFNHAIEANPGEALPAPGDIEGYVYVGYLKDGRNIAGQEQEAIKSEETSQPIANLTEQVVTKTEALPFEVQTVENPDLPAGTSRLVQEGQDGEKTLEVKQTLVNGQIVKEEIISSTITKASLPKIIEVGPQKIVVPTPVVSEDIVTSTESIPFETQVVYSETLTEGTRQVGQTGQAGQKRIETKNIYVDGKLASSEVLSEVVMTAPIPEIIYLGVKPITEVPATAPSHEVPAATITEETTSHTESIPFEVQEVYLDTLPEGTRQVSQTGQAGQKQIDTKNTYVDGQLVKSEVVSETILTAASPEVVYVGTKPITEVPATAPSHEVPALALTEETTSRTESVPFEDQIVYDDTLAEGSQTVDQPGQDGVRTIVTQNYYADGVLLKSETVSDMVTTAPTPKITRIGTKKPDVITSESDFTKVAIAFETVYVDDPTLPVGQEKELVQGVDGEKTITTTYQVINGVRQANPTITEDITKPVINRQIARGTKVEEVPTVVITDLIEAVDAKSATLTYELTDPTTNFISAAALLYDESGNLVQEQAIPDANGQLTLTNLDYYKNYTVKTRITYTIAGQQRVSEQESIIESKRDFDLLYKKIEVKDIDAVTIYRRKDGTYVGSQFLDALPTGTDDLFIKVSSDRFKDVYLPVTRIEETTKDGKAAYKVLAAIDELVEDKNSQYVANREFYIPKMASDANTYTSFKELVAAMKANPSGTFKLGADLYADEVVVGDVASYVGNFSGTLTGANDGYNFAIHNLKAPLFLNFNNGTISNLDIKNANLSTSIQYKLGTIAHITNGSKITDVSIEATIKGPQDVAGFVHTAYYTTFKNVSFTGTIESYGTGTTRIGGIVGDSILSPVVQAKVDATLILPGATNQFAGGIAGRMMVQQEVPGATIQNSYATGSIVTTDTGGFIGGIAGTNQDAYTGGGNVGNVNNVVSDMTGPTSIIGNFFGANTRVANAFSTSSDTHPNVQTISEAEAQAKLAAMNITTTLEDSTPINLNNYSVDYLSLANAKASHATAYNNMEKILPFYNKELLVYYGNKVAVDDKLNKVRLVDVIAMKDNLVVADAFAEKANINKIMLHYEDGSVEYKTVSYLEDFKNNYVVEYTIDGTDLIYTPESFLGKRETLVNDLVATLAAVTLDSPEVKALVNFPTTLDANRQKGTADDFYFGDSFANVQNNLAAYVRKVLVSSLNGQGAASEAYIKERITANKEAFILGLTYLTRWYDINYGDLNTTDLTIFEGDFFGNESASALEAILAIGNAGYEAIRPYNNVKTYATTLAKQNRQESVFKLVEAYRERFLPTKTNNEWFKETTKAYVVESKSLIPEVAAKQEAADTYSKYSVGAYDKIVNDTVTGPTWKYNHMLLPLLTLPQENIYVITNMNTVAIGAYEKYQTDYSDPAQRDQMRQRIELAAERQRDNADFWYKIVDDESKDKLFRSVLNTDSFLMYGSDGQRAYRDLTSNIDAIQDFFGPINKWYNDKGVKTAYADGNETYYVHYEMLSDYGTAIYTHEMVHNQDGSIYLLGNGRRNGLGMELYAQGLLQNVFNPNELNLGFNAIFESDSSTRVHAGDPVNRYNSEQDLNDYFHHQFDVLYLLDYLEGMAILEKPDALKKDWLKKIENYYIKTNNVDTHAGNKARALTDDEVAQLKDFNDLIDQSIITHRQFFGVNQTSKEWARNSYVSVPMFSPIYSALSNANGAPGDVMFRRMAYELIAAKGYSEGFVPYASAQLSDYAISQGSTIYDTWSKTTVGLVTDKHVLDQVFQGQYKTWEDFKKAMFAERVAQAEAGKLKPFTMQYEMGVPDSTKEVTVSSYAQLQDLMREAMEADTNGRIYYSTNNVNLSRVHALKVKVYQAMMNATDDFRESIFEAS
ncbi:YSIRK signal domain/LPXTG anchor domain surface protein [Streptococcus plurextorum]|uniref:YSIRK signal domain/LPXTG anchor domain surface protein n=1 Tax=Streptococcus plurextorum TaxID=456876 RepID=UPI000487EED9|nr:YSIRK signal domain/LPXTG anchor domain surface protein [Streptococcus plurextorum]